MASLFASGVLAGCSLHSKPPYANDPVLFHYKPDTADSATILAQQQGSRPPSEPPLPLALRNSSRSAGAGMPPGPVVPTSSQIEQPLPPPAPFPLQSSKPDFTAPLAPPPFDSQPPARSLAQPPGPNALSQPSNVLAPPEASAPMSPPSSLPTRPAEFAAAASSPIRLLPPNREQSAFESTDTVSAAKYETKSAPFQPVPTKPTTASPFAPEPPPPAFADAPPPVPNQARAARNGTMSKPVADQQAKHKIAPGDFGHDSTYHWIQGTLERPYHAEVCVRFSDPAVEDQYGGKVRLDDERLLADFREGDVIGLEGEMVPPSDQDRPGSPPHFLIRDVWLVRKK